MRWAGHYCSSQNCGCSSVGRAPPCQGGRREFEPRHPLQPSLVTQCKRRLERVRRSFSEAKPYKLRLAGQSCNALRLPVYLWRRTAEMHWLKAHEDRLQAHAHGELVIVRRPARKRLELEIVCRSRSDSSTLLKEFSGHIEALPPIWLERFARSDSKPFKIGKRLMVVRSIHKAQSCGVGCRQRRSHHRARPDALRTADSTVSHR